MNLRILEFRAKMAFRLAIIADKVFGWSVKRYDKLHEQIKGVKE